MRPWPLLAHPIELTPDDNLTLLAERRGRTPDAVAALVDLDRASPLAQLEAAFGALGKRLDLVVRGAA